MKKYMIFAFMAIGWTVCSSCTRQSAKPAATTNSTSAPKAEKTAPAAPRRLTDAEYRKAQKEWLAENARKDSVVTLKSGLQYKILRQGDGKIPRKSSKVCIHYEGRTTDGSLFDSSYERQMALTMSVSDFIDGWQEALCLMPVGSKWEIYVPHYLAYGKEDGMPFRPYSTLIFTIELLSIEK